MANTNLLNLKLITLLGEKVNNNVYEVILPTKTGEITVLPDHEPLVSLLDAGAMAIRHQKTDTNDKLEYYAVSGGVVEITRESVVVLVDEAESDREISETEAKAAYERAVKASEEVKDIIELEEAKKSLSHHAARLKVAELGRRYKGRIKQRHTTLEWRDDEDEDKDK